MKKILIFTSILALAVVVGGCSSRSHEKTKSHEKIVQTHQYDDITRLRANMRQKHGNKESMGSIRFIEVDSGLSMDVNLFDTRPNVEYSLCVYDMKDCDKKGIKAGTCEKERKDIVMPTLQSDRDGMISKTYLINGLTAAQMDNAKIVLTRKDANGEKVEAGWGRLRERRF